MSYNNSHSVIISSISKYLTECCNKAYEQGRADSTQEFSKQFDMLYADKLEQIKADERTRTIEEFVSIHNKCNVALCDKVGKGISCCECIAEQLKE